MVFGVQWTMPLYFHVFFSVVLEVYWQQKEIQLKVLSLTYLDFRLLLFRSNCIRCHSNRMAERKEIKFFYCPFFFSLMCFGRFPFMAPRFKSHPRVVTINDKFYLPPSQTNSACLSVSFMPSLFLGFNCTPSHYLSADLMLIRVLSGFLWKTRLLDLHTTNSLDRDTNSYKKFCEKPNLPRRHQEFCENGTNILQVIGRGIDMAIDECQHQFHMSRWNCSSLTGNTTSTIFGGALSSRKSLFLRR